MENGMDFIAYSKAINGILEEDSNPDIVNIRPNSHQFFLQELESLAEEKSSYLKKTQAHILCEGFYQYLPSSLLKKTLGQLRAKLWSQHFGVPTLSFLISYMNEIADTRQFFACLTETPKNPGKKAWLFLQDEEMLIDDLLQIVVKPNCINKIPIPYEKEEQGAFFKTYNPEGGFTTTPNDPVSQRFLEHAKLCATHNGRVLEVGAAFGTATLEALAKGATVFCNDIDALNLAVIRNRFRQMCNHDMKVSGDCSQLILLPGELPEELAALPESYFDAILICRVLHFLPGKTIDDSLSLFNKLLSPQGKLYVVCETPYLKNWQKFLPEFDRRVELGCEWPGEISNVQEYEICRRDGFLPKFVNWITQDVLERSFKNAGFKITHSAYINRKGQFPEDLVFPEYGKESIGVIGIK
jgi:ubiquinone/menaquinone biosynthesis C-methylase UbiE